MHSTLKSILALHIKIYNRFFRSAPFQVSYRASSQCGPYSKDYNFNVCYDYPNPPSCPQTIPDPTCPSKLATLKNLYGDETIADAFGVINPVKIGTCEYVYFAIYVCRSHG